MPLKLTFENGDFEKDQEFEIAGVGVVTNGKSVTLTEDQERDFVSRHYQTVKEAFKDSESVKIEGTTELSGGLKGVLGVDPAEISDTPSPDPTAENLDPETGKVFKDHNINGTTTEPEVVTVEEAGVAVVPEETKEEVNK